jgi:hypothetical protein
MSLAALSDAVANVGLSLRGDFHCRDEDGVPVMADGRAIKTLVLLGWIGGAQWAHFAASREASDGKAHSLDRWSKRVIDGLASSLGASACYPFGGPPYLPFQRWARRGDDVFPSPLGLYVHADHGLWHSYRGAIGFAETLVLTRRSPRASPCETCADKPCLSACPVAAFTPGHYDVERCAEHVKLPRGEACHTGGCLARRACWVAPQLAYQPDEAGFYMTAFAAAH